MEAMFWQLVQFVQLVLWFSCGVFHKAGFIT